MGERFTSATDTYDVDAPFAEGASGLAYRARSSRLGLVFLKQLKLAGTRDWKTVELFEREARVLAGLEHPAIPRYLDYFHDEQRGSFILVQTLIDAPSLQDLLDRQQVLTPEQLRAILEQGLEVLEYLHTRVPPVLHRDISPKNFLFAADRLALVDFGAVKLSLRESSTMTSAGTFGYMAPEQILGQALPASDLYGLGMVVIALATHDDPSNLPLDPSRGGIDLAQVLPRIPTTLRPLVEALVQPGLADRVDSAGAALRLLRAPPPAPVVPQPAGPSPARRALIGLRRHPVRNTLVGLLALFLVARLVASLIALPGQTGQLGGWTRGHTQFIVQLTGALLGDHDILARPHEVQAIAFSPDGTLVATAAHDRVLLWDRERGVVLHDLAAPNHGADWLRFSPRGATLWAAGRFEATLIRWNTGTGAVEERLDLEMLPGSEGFASELLDLVASDDDHLAVLAQKKDGTGLVLFEREHESIKPRWLDDHGPEAALSADGQRLAVLDARPNDGNKQIGTVLLRDLRTDQQLARFSQLYLETMALSPDGRTVALINSRGVALHHPGEAHEPRMLLFGLDGYDYNLKGRFSADGSRLLVASGRRLTVFDVPGARIAAQFEYERTLLDSMTVTALAINADGTQIATGNDDEVTRLWHVEGPPAP